MFFLAVPALTGLISWPMSLADPGADVHHRRALFRRPRADRLGAAVVLLPVVARGARGGRRAQDGDDGVAVFAFLKALPRKRCGMTDVAAPLPLALPRSPRRVALDGGGDAGARRRRSRDAAVAAASRRRWRSPAVVGVAALTLCGAGRGDGDPVAGEDLHRARRGLAPWPPRAAIRRRSELGFALRLAGAAGGRREAAFAEPRAASARRPARRWRSSAGCVAALAAFNAYYVIVSQDLMIADFMFYRVVSVAVGTLRQGGPSRASADRPRRLPSPRDYSWAPALAPGLALAAFGLLSRAVYQGAILVCYAAPALLALGWAAREIAGAPTPRRRRARLRPRRRRRRLSVRHRRRRARDARHRRPRAVRRRAAARRQARARAEPARRPRARGSA